MTIEYISVPSSLTRAFRFRVLQALLPLAKPLRERASQSPDKMRQALNGIIRFTRAARGAQVEYVELSGRPAEKVSAPQTKHTVLYLHGGAYVAGSPRTHRSISTHLALASQSTVWVLDYRLAPEHPFPAATDDALAAYKALLDQGIPAHQITIAGDSAGGGLTAATALRIRDEKLPLPKNLILLSPWVDLTHVAQTQQNLPYDPMLSWKLLGNSRDFYAGDSRDPHVSPLFGSWQGLPPTLIITGTEEILLSDSTRLFEKLQQEGVESRCLLYRKMWHVFPALAGKLSEADHAIDEMAIWINRTAASQSGS